MSVHAKSENARDSYLHFAPRPPTEPDRSASPGPAREGPAPHPPSVDLALYEAGFRASEDSLVRYATDRVVRERSGNLNDRIVPATDLVTADDRRVSVHAGTDTLFRRLCQLVGRPELSDDPRYATRLARVEHQDALYELLHQWAATMTADELVTACSDVNIPASPVMTIADIAADPHYRARGSIVDVPDEDFGVLPMAAPFPRLSATPGSIRSTGPSLGSANKEIYQELLGLDDDAFADLLDSAVI